MGEPRGVGRPGHVADHDEIAAGDGRPDLVGLGQGDGGVRVDDPQRLDPPLADRAVTTPPALTRTYSAAERAALAAGTTEDWSREAWTVSRDTAYRLALGDPCGPKPTARVQLDEPAIQAAIEPQRVQVTRAGLRLARLLDEAFDPARAFTAQAGLRRPATRLGQARPAGR